MKILTKFIIEISDRTKYKCDVEYRISSIINNNYLNSQLTKKHSIWTYQWYFCYGHYTFHVVMFGQRQHNMEHLYPGRNKIECENTQKIDVLHKI